MRKILLFFFLTFYGVLFAQTSDCNKLGAWLWYIDITGFSTHSQIADTLVSIGVKRVYVKVSDGQPNTSIWPELQDTSLVNAYKARGLEVWGWSYNYPGNAEAQSQALYLAAKTGYQGFVVDVETEFDGLSTPLSSLFAAFADKKQQAIAAGYADTHFQLYCTTWGNPADHNFQIGLIDPYIDGYMPQTYVEIWGASYVQNLAYWIQVGNEEYISLGATKPIHHIAALESGGMTPAQIDLFIQNSGPETSLWRIPGGQVPNTLWQTWNAIDWNADFCASSSTDVDPALFHLDCMPNPTNGKVQVGTKGESGILSIWDVNFRKMEPDMFVTIGENLQLDLAEYPPGMYILHFTTGKNVWVGKILKQ